MARLAGILCVAVLWLAGRAAAQVSTASVRTFGSASASADSVRLRIDGPEQAADVGSGAFTIEQWLRCADADNPPLGGSARAGDTENAGVDWIDGRIFLDRDIDGAPSAGGGDWGASLYPAAGDTTRRVVRFGAERGSGAQLTIQGSIDVCDDTWHHVAVGRDNVDRLFLYVDGIEDYRSAATIAGNLSYPDGTGAAQDPFLVWGSEKHGYQAGYVGYLDELRVWDRRRTSTEVHDARFTSLPGDTAGLVLYLRLEEGDRVGAPETLVDATGRHDGALLYNGLAGDGEWSTSVPAGGAASSTTSTSSTSTTSATGSHPGSTTTSTLLPPACMEDPDCDDLDPCTVDSCGAGRCAIAQLAGLASAICELDRLRGSSCLGELPRKILRPIGRRLEKATRRLEGAAGFRPEQPRRRRGIERALRALASAERRIEGARANGRLDPVCGGAVLEILERARVAASA